MDRSLLGNAESCKQNLEVTPNTEFQEIPFIYFLDFINENRQSGLRQQTKVRDFQSERNQNINPSVHQNELYYRENKNT